jgi:hypothetical protein
MKKLRFAFLAAFFFNLIVVSGVRAQTGQLTLQMWRDWGYGGLNGDIEGLFSMHVTGPVDLARVEYYIDNTIIGKVTQPPFTLQFTTDNYSLGIHTLFAIGYSKGGQEYRSNVISANFVPKQSSMKIILPILGVVVAAILLSTVVPLLARRGKQLAIPLGAERDYGVAGGGICPKCHRPYKFPLYSTHLGFSKLAHCPFCGKWSLVRTESIVKLREAEKAELEWTKPARPPEVLEEEKLSEEIDESKYQDL